MRYRNKIAAALASACVAMSAMADEIPIDQLPGEVRSAIEHRFPRAEFLEANRLLQDGRTKYDVEIGHGGKRYEVEIWADGIIIDIDPDLF